MGIDFLGEGGFDRRSTSWSDILPTLWRHKLAIVLMFFATVAGAYATLEVALSDRYDSEAKLLVKLGRENSEAPPTVTNSALFTSGIHEQELNSEVQMLTSRSVSERVVDRIGPDAFKFIPLPPKTVLQAFKYRVKQAGRFAKRQYKELLYASNIKKRLTDREEAILAVESATSVEVEKDSNVIGVRVGLPSGPLSMQVAQALLDFYFDDHIRVMRTNEARSFFDQQVEGQLAALKHIEQQRDAIREQWNLSSVPEQRRLALERWSSTVAELGSNDAQLEMLNAQRATTIERASTMPDRLQSSEVVTPNPTAQSVNEHVAALKMQRAKLATVYSEDSVAIRNINDEIASVDGLRAKEEPRQIGSQTTEINPVKRTFNQSIDEISVKMSGLQANNQKLSAVKSQIENQLRQLNAGESVLATVERDRGLAEQNYLASAKHLEEARIAEELDARRVANVVVLSPPSTPIEPAYPPKLLIMGLALMVGSLLGVGMALLLEYMRDTIETPKDLATVDGVAFLGSFHLDSEHKVRKSSDTKVAAS